MKGEPVSEHVAGSFLWDRAMSAKHQNRVPALDYEMLIWGRIVACYRSKKFHLHPDTPHA